MCRVVHPRRRFAAQEICDLARLECSALDLRKAIFGRAQFAPDMCIDSMELIRPALGMAPKFTAPDRRSDRSSLEEEHLRVEVGSVDIAGATPHSVAEAEAFRYFSDRMGIILLFLGCNHDEGFVLS